MPNESQGASIRCADHDQARTAPRACRCKRRWSCQCPRYFLAGLIVARCPTRKGMAAQDEKIDRIRHGVARMSKAHIANHYLQACVRGAERRGHRASDLLHSAEIPLQWLNRPEQLVTEAQLTRLIKTVWRATGDEFMGLAPARCRSGVFALMAEFALPSQTLGAFLGCSARFYRTVCNEIDIGLESGGADDEGLVFFRLALTDPQYDTDHLLQEFLLLMWQRLSCWLVDRQIGVAATHFSYPPPGHAAEYAALFPGQLLFNQHQCGFSLHARYLQLPIIRSEKELAGFLKASPAYILHRPVRDDRLQARVRWLLSQYDFQAMPGLDAIAAQLNSTPRTISRKLQEEGISFSQIKDGLRQDYATKLLSTENLSVAAISERLGFSEVASFCRAYKRWTGCSPSKGPGIRA